MAVYISYLIDELRDILGDESDSSITFANKQRYLNSGMAAMYPDIYQIIRGVGDDPIDSTVYEYDVPDEVSVGKLISVEIESGDGTEIFARDVRYDLIQGQPSDRIRLSQSLGGLDGATLRYVAAVPLSPSVAADYTAAGTELYTGPDPSWQLPVYYALSLIFSRTLFARMDYGRQSVQYGNTGVGMQDLMVAAQFWMDRFDAGVASLAMVLPVASY